MGFFKIDHGQRSKMEEVRSWWFNIGFCGSVFLLVSNTKAVTWGNDKEYFPFETEVSGFIGV